MPEPLLSIRSARARELAHSLAKLEKRSVRAVVEDALEAYAASKGRSSFKEFMAKVQAHTWPEEDGEISLDDLNNENRKPHKGIDLTL